MEKLRVGVIGVGYLGKFHAQKYAAMEEAELVGVADPNLEAAEAVAAMNHTRAFADYHELFGQVDAVSIVVPTRFHHQVGMECLDAGLHLMMEKPITTTVAEADELIELAAKKGLILQVGHLERYNPAVMAMAEYLTTPLFVESHRIHVFKPRGLDVDVVLDLMIHDIDIVMSLIDSPLVDFHAVGLPVVTETTDIANVRLIFENGATANVTVSRISQDNTRRLRIFQPNSFLAVDYAGKELTCIRQLEGFDEEGQPRREISKSCYMEKDALEMELRDFVANVVHGRVPMVGGEEGRRALDLAGRIISQIKENAAKSGALKGF